MNEPCAKRKMRFPSRKIAEARAKKINSQDPDAHLRAYRCAECGSFHMTSGSPRLPQQVLMNGVLEMALVSPRARPFYRKMAREAGIQIID